MSNSTVTLAAFTTNNPNEDIRIHAAGCNHVIRETRNYGMPVMVVAESRLALVRGLKRKNIRSNSLRFMGCIGVPESFAILAPNGERVSSAVSRAAASKATSRITREARRELTAKLNSLSTFARMELDKIGNQN